MNHSTFTKPRAAQKGVFVVEFALIAIAFFLVLFGIIEVARVLFLWNSVQEITRHAARDAASADFTNLTTMKAIRNNALFNPSSGVLLFSGNIDESYVTIDYMWLDVSGAMWPVAGGSTPMAPATATQNVINCATNPNQATCIRFVRVQLCQPPSTGDACTPVNYTEVVPLLSGLFSSADNPLQLPTSPTVVPVETLGRHSGNSL